MRLTRVFGFLAVAAIVLAMTGTGWAQIYTGSISGRVNDQTGAKEVYVADYDGREVKKVTSNRSLNLLPRWRPDGRAVAFTSAASRPSTMTRASDSVPE